MSQPAHGSWIASSMSRQTHCGCHPGMPASANCPAANGVASRFAACCSPSPTCCCSMNRPTTSMPSQSPGSNVFLRNIPAPSSPSRTIVTSSTTSLAGFSNWTVAMEFPGKATTRPGYSKKNNALRRKRRRRKRGIKQFRQNSAGFGPIRRVVAPSPRRVSSNSRNSRRRPIRSGTKPTRSTFRRDRVSAISSSKSRA